MFAVSPAYAVASLECAGHRTASHAIIYLHGVDPPRPTVQEQGNRQLLTKLAKSEGIALAMPRATTACMQKAFKGKLCWPRSTDEVLQKEFQRILATTAKCYKPSATLGMIGFSNGGYFINKLISDCTPGQVRWFLSIGSAGASRSIRTGSACGHLQLLIGRYDMTHNEARRYAQELQRLGRSVEFTDFDGGHIIPEQATRDAIRSFKRR